MEIELIVVIAVLGTILAVYMQVREANVQEQALKKDIWDSRIGQIERDLAQRAVVSPRSVPPIGQPGPTGQFGPIGPVFQIGAQGHTGATGIVHERKKDICPYCGQRYVKDETYCTHCGAQRSQ